MSYLTCVIVDASPYDLDAVLTKLLGLCWCVVSYALRSLTDVERHYSQTEQEALAFVCARECFPVYVYGIYQVSFHD